MEEDKIKELFHSFEPSLSDSKLFMRRLEERMDLVEMVKKYNEAQQRSNRRAVVIAALVGFIAGAFFTSILPWLTVMFKNIFESLSIFQFPEISELGLLTLVYCIIGASTIWIAINAYFISLKFLNPKPYPIK